MYKQIGEYGIIGNLRTVALVGRDGAIDWFCHPHIDSPSIFGALLDDTSGGSFTIRPSGEFDAAQRYVPGTNILQTRFRTRTGVMLVTDFMPVYPEDEQGQDAEASEATSAVLFRKIEVERGFVETLVLFMPRFGYGAEETTFETLPGGVLARGGDQAMALSCSKEVMVQGNRAVGAWAVMAGETVWCWAGADGTMAACPPSEVRCEDPARGETALERTTDFWRSWLKRSESGRSLDFGPYAEAVERSALVLKLLYYAPSGSIAAAPTTSLPEYVGGDRNWDYRFTWIRDSAFTLTALHHLGHLTETEGYLRFLSDVLAGCGEAGGKTIGEALQVMYGLRGETELPERTLDHLDGYKGSRPVRVGNGAARQCQLDIYGEVLDAALKLSDYVGRVDEPTWRALAALCEHVRTHWTEEDSGIWEVRGGTRHFLSSKVFCWVALDRGVKIATRYGFQADIDGWRESMAAIRAEVLAKGYNETQGSFVQHYETTSLDASALLIPLLGFLPFGDPRVVSTIEAIQRKLTKDGLVRRYLVEETDDGMRSDEGVFLLCSFWLVECLAGLGRVEEAETLLRRLMGLSNRLGLYAEEYGTEMDELLGNYPQAFSHIGFVNAVMSLLKARAKQDAAEEAEERESGFFEQLRRLAFAEKLTLNEGEPREVLPPEAIAPELKGTMNLLRGAFFDTEAGRVAYERMRDSDIYERFADVTRNLHRFDPAVLTTDAEKQAFWINLYNVLVIHGVIALSIHDSVKEVRSFFTRVGYSIGGLSYTPDEIEHGILRGNKARPGLLGQARGPIFAEDDPRLAHVVREPDPRIHFALVCATQSCPPIAVYTAERIDEELDLAGRAFVSGTAGCSLERERGVVRLSRIFDWYEGDFGETKAERLNFAAGFFHSQEAREYVEKNASRLGVEYMDYDWRLNR